MKYRRIIYCLIGWYNVSYGSWWYLIYFKEMNTNQETIFTHNVLFHGLKYAAVMQFKGFRFNKLVCT